MFIERVNNVEEAIELASALKSEGKYNWFRGQVRADWKPSSSNERKQQGGTKSKELNEDLDRFLDWARNIPELAYLEDEKSEHALFAIRQHYGHPTNYIDFTTDPSVAGFFASDSSRTPDQGTISAIFCLNTEHLIEYYNKYISVIDARMKVEPVSVDVTNLWRLQAQHGHFLKVNHSWYEVYDMDRIEFPWTGLPAYPQRNQIYPEQKSHLEQLLDEFEEREQRRLGQIRMLSILDELKQQGVQVAMTPWITDEARYQKSRFKHTPKPLESWEPTALSSWLQEHRENFDEVVGLSVDLRIRSEHGAPEPHVQVRNAFLSALSRQPQLRAKAVSWNIQGLEGLQEVSRYQTAVQAAWNGMRNLPYDNLDIAESMGALTQLFIIGGCDSILGHIKMRSFIKWKADAVEVEFGNDALNSVSRTYCSDASLLNCLKTDWKDNLKDPAEISSTTDALWLCSKPNLMFNFDAFAHIFARQIIPAQLAQDRSLVLFNPARINFFGNP